MKLGPKIILNDRERLWFMSDLHYNHQNILHINPQTRLFKDINQMNEYILEELKKKVKPGDILFDLGDLIWREKPSDIALFRDLLPERSYRIWGNHDSEKNLKAWGGVWKIATDLLDVIVKKDGVDQRLVLSHYPILDWNGRFHGSWNIHGHCHGNIDQVNRESGEKRIDVGFDSEIAKKEGSFLIPYEKIWEELVG